MKRVLLCIVCSMFYIASFAQIVKLGERFTKVPVVEDKVTFLKEIPGKKGLSIEENYKLLKDWAVPHYARDPFISSIRYDLKNHEFIAKSKIELLLPVNSQGVREKMIMRYRINGFIFQDKCVLEVTEISYLYENAKKNTLLSRVMKAEEFITDDAILVRDELQEFRANTRKSTLYFLDELTKDLEAKFGY